MKKIIYTVLFFNLIACQKVQFSAHRNTFAGSGAIFEKNQFVKQDVCNVLNKFDLVTINDSICKINSLPPTSDEERIMIANRNNMLYYIISMSDQKCGVYQKSILSKKSSFDFYTGSISTLFSGVGAILSHQATAQVFSAAAGVLTSSKAEFDKSFFNNLAINVIISGIDQVRSEMQSEIVDKLENDLITYPVTAALSDAMKYHGKCTAVIGLTKAQDDIAIVEQMHKEERNNEELFNH